MEKINNFKKVLINNKILVLILLLSFFASITYSFYWQIRPAVDARAYDVIAMNIVDGYGYREMITKDIKYDYAIARVGPLYQYFLAGTYKVFGHNYGAVWIIQALLHAISAWLIYLVALLIFPPKAGPSKTAGRQPWADKQHQYKEKVALWAAVLFGFYPDLIEISAMLMIETLYLFLFLLMLFFFFKYFNKENAWSVSLLGIISGLTVLARPPILFLIPVILFYFYRRKAIPLMILFCVMMGIVFVPWTVRNYKVYDEFMPFGVAGGFNFWIGNHHGANGEQEQPLEATAFLATHEIKDLQKKSLAETKIFLYNYPVEFVKLTALRINKYFSIIRPMGFWFYQTGLSQFIFLILSALASVILFIFGLAGFLYHFKLDNKLVNYLSAFTIITPLIIFVTVVETRYRFQIYPLLMIFAGYFIVFLFKQKKWQLNKIFLLAAAIILTNGLIDLILSMEKFRERINWFF